MSDVASIELCKELYELSGWQNDTAWWCWVEAHQDYEINNGKPKFPAYDLGYLLRKLPQYTTLRKNAVKSKGNSEGNWKGGYTIFVDHNPERLRSYADTPEDAAAKLCVELFNQGVLKSAT